MLNIVFGIIVDSFRYVCVKFTLSVSCSASPTYCASLFASLCVTHCLSLTVSFIVYYITRCVPRFTYCVFLLPHTVLVSLVLRHSLSHSLPLSVFHSVSHATTSISAASCVTRSGRPLRIWRARALSAHSKHTILTALERVSSTTRNA